MFKSVCEKNELVFSLFDNWNGSLCKVCTEMHPREKNNFREVTWVIVGKLLQKMKEHICSHSGIENYSSVLNRSFKILCIFCTNCWHYIPCLYRPWHNHQWNMRTTASTANVCTNSWTWPQFAHFSVDQATKFRCGLIDLYERDEESATGVGQLKHGAFDDSFRTILHPCFVEPVPDIPVLSLYCIQSFWRLSQVRQMDTDYLFTFVNPFMDLSTILRGYHELFEMKEGRWDITWSCLLSSFSGELHLVTNLS